MRKRKMRLAYMGEQLRAISFPLGGIGAGQVALCGDGGLRQWQIFNNINHNAHVPFSFFAFFAKQGKSRPLARVLQSSARYDDTFEPAPLVTDHLVPAASRLLLENLPHAESITFIGEYPVAGIVYSLPEFPVEVSLEAYSPFVPLDPDDSGLPAIIFHFNLRNLTNREVTASILMSQQNAVGWDDATEIDGIKHSSYGGNRNRTVQCAGLIGVELTNLKLPADHPRQGQMVLAALSESATVRSQWVDLEELWKDFADDGRLENSKNNRPSPDGQTVNAALASLVELKPRCDKRLTFLLTWYFPNRYVDWLQPTFHDDESMQKSKLWTGNYYASRFGSATDVAEYVRDNLGRFDDAAARFRKAIYDSSLPAPLIDAVSSQISVMRSPTCLRTADGGFYAFEGCCGLSSIYEGDRGGCCPLNCTHVWNYAMTMSRLFPQLERGMRETEWLCQQHESGYLPHRVVIPLYLRRTWGRWMHGPLFPALDGLLGAILQTYREYRISGDLEWLASIWNNVRLGLDHAIARYDRGDGVIHGPQPCTYDVEIQGPNSFMESLYLAALRAGEEMAKALGDAGSAKKYCGRFRTGRDAADKLLWNGEYYVHKYDPETESFQAYGPGCHSNQLYGQWWAYSAGLGYVLPRNHVRRALSSIVKYNSRKDFIGHQQAPRNFVRDDETGLVNCTWPKDGRPELPLIACDEVWTSMEYEVAASLLYEGMVDEALAIVATTRRRQDGRLRSPWNEIECGDHYVRSMTSWMLLEAAAGYVYDAPKSLVGFTPRISPHNFKCFFSTADGWGRFSQRSKGSMLTAQLSVYWGTVRLRELRLSHAHANSVSAMVGSKNIPLSARAKRGNVIITFTEQVTIEKDQTLRVSIR